MTTTKTTSKAITKTGPSPAAAAPSGGPIEHIVKQVKAARRVSTPLVAVVTSDPAATIAALCKGLPDEAPKVSWDIVRGFQEHNEAGAEALAKVVGESGDKTPGNAGAAVRDAMKLPAHTVLFIHQADRYLESPYVVQALWLMRDKFKTNHRMAVLLTPGVKLPPELAGDVVVFDEPLPGVDELRTIIQGTYKDALLGDVPEDTLSAAVEAVQGLPAFQAEQVVAMSLRKDGVDVDALWERKRQQIELTPGLKVHRGGETFAGIGGVETVKTYLSRILHGQARPNTVVFVDEIEKMLAGAGGNDGTGVNTDQLGTLLTYMQDQGAVGMIFVGPPGSAKSMVAKAAGNEAGIPTIQLDLGSVKGRLVGDSEKGIRAALKVITSVSNGKTLWIATCNAIGDLPPELRRRFTLGTFFFDLPDDMERDAIWWIHEQAYDVGHGVGHGVGGEDGEDPRPEDEGWTGAEIRQCCDIAWRLNIPLKEAGKYVVPVSVSARDQIANLRSAANGRFLSASTAGVYREQKSKGTKRPAGRAVAAHDED